MVSRYVNGPVKQEGICLLPPPHYRMMPPQRADGFPVSTPTTYVPQQPNQGGNQGPGLRAIAPPGPPNQASTPPNADLKVQSLPQQPSMSHMYVPQVRSGQAAFFTPRTAGPTNQSQRMPNHNNRPPQPMYGGQTQFVPIQPMYIPAANVPYYQRPPGFVQSSIPIYTGQHITSFQYNPPPTQTQPYYYNNAILPRTGPLQTAQPTAPNPTQPAIPNVPLVHNPPQQQTFPRQQHKRRPNAISIIDPHTGADRLNEIYDQDNSHPPSGESSARQTPQPTTSKEVQAAFAKQVLQAINKDVESSHIDDSDHLDPAEDHIEQPSYPPPPPQPAVQSSNRLEHIVQSSTLKVQAKEFVLPYTAKETPIVSANCDAVEVTLPNKSPKDRESPAKGRKQREQTARESQHKEPVPAKEAVCDKQQSSVVKDVEVKQKETSPPAPATNVPQAFAPQGKEGGREGAPQEKRGQKKEKSEAKAPNVEASEVVQVAPALAQPVPAAQDAAASGKW